MYLIQRFLNKIIIIENGCWIWTASLNSYGYGKFRYNSMDQGAHRFIYEYLNGLIPKKLEIDHLCRNRDCVNPTHLELVDHNTNLKRGNAISTICSTKTQCPNGHPYSGKNLLIIKAKYGIGRRCRICYKKSIEKYRAKQL